MQLLHSLVLLLGLPVCSSVRPSQTSDDVSGELSTELEPNKLARLRISFGGHVLHDHSWYTQNMSKQSRQLHSKLQVAAKAWGPLEPAAISGVSEPASSLQNTRFHAGSWLQNMELPPPENGSSDGTDSAFSFFVMPVGFLIGSALLAVCASSIFEQLHETVDKSIRDCNAIWIMNITTWFLFNTYVTVIIPESAQLAESMGRNPVDSGYLIGGIFFLSGFYMLPLRQYFNPWQQPLMSKVALGMTLGGGLSAALYAFSANPPSDSWTGSLRFSLCMFARIALPGAESGAILYLLMLLRVTPAKDAVNLTLVVTTAKIVGYGSGPLISALATQLLEPADVRGRASYPVWGVAVLFWMNFVFGCFLLPGDLSDAQEQKDKLELENDENRRSSESLSMQVESHGSAESLPEQSLQSAAPSLPESVKRQIWTMGVLIGAQRALVVSSIESATTFILEREFGNTAHYAGVMVCLSLWAGIPVYVVKCYFKSTSWPSEVLAFRIAGAVSVVASLLFVKSVSRAVAALLHLELQQVILFGDAVLYPAAYLASGLMDGLVGTIAMPGTNYNMDNYFLMDALLQNSFARGLAPVYARYLLFHYGRNSYAWAQFSNLAISLIGNVLCVPLCLPSPLRKSEAGRSSSASKPRILQG